MCRKFAKYGLLLALLGIASFIGGGILSAFGFVAAWWSFPGSWTPLNGLPDRPQALLAMEVPSSTILLQTESGQQFACSKEGCLPAESAWSQSTEACDLTTRPAVVSLFPVLVSWNIDAAFGCEISYQSTGRTAFVIHDRQGHTYIAGGPTFIPTDAGAIGIGILGGLIIAVIVLVVSGILILVRTQSKRKATLPEDTPVGGST